MFGVNNKVYCCNTRPSYDVMRLVKILIEGKGRSLVGTCLVDLRLLYRVYQHGTVFLRAVPQRAE